MKRLLALFTLLSLNTYAQVGIGTTTPEGALDITSTNEGILIPRVALTNSTTASPLISPTISEMIYNTATIGDVTPGYYYWGGTSWTRIATGPTSWSILGNSGTTAGTNFIGTTDNKDLVFKTNNIERFRNFNATGNTSFGSSSDANNAKVNISSTNTTSALYALLNSTITTTSQGISVFNNTPTASGSNKRGALFSVSDSGSPNLRIGIETQISTASNSGSNNYFLYNNFIPTATVGVSTIFLLNSMVDTSLDINAPMSGLKNSFNFKGTSTGIVNGVINDIRTTSADKAGVNNILVSNSSGTASRSIGQLTSHTGTGNHSIYGTLNSLALSGTGPFYGTYNTSDMVTLGSANTAGPATNSIFYGVYNDFKNTGNGAHYGNYTNLTGTGTGNKFGEYIEIPTTAGGTHYGIYSNVLSATGFAGYYLGKVSIGTAAGNEYILPASRGTNGQIMTTDGSGNVTWTTPSSLTGWTLTGNAGTTPGTNFIGTTDANDIVFKANNNVISRIYNSSKNTSIASTSTDRDAKLSIEVATGESANYGLYVTNDHNSSGTGSIYSAYFKNNGTNASSKYGIWNEISNSGTGIDRVGILNYFPTTGGNNNYGTQNFMTPSSASYVAAGTYNNFSNAGATTTGTNYGVLTSIVVNANSTSKNYGISNSLVTTSASRYGVYNSLITNAVGTNLSTTEDYGVYNELSGDGNHTLFGEYNNISNTGSGKKYGSYSIFSGTSTGIVYGNYADIPGATNYSGYFLGRFAIGTTSADTYIMPTTRGTAGQIMVTDGSGIVSWSSPTTNSINTTSGSGNYIVSKSEYTIRILDTVSQITLPNAATSTGKMYILIGTNGISSKILSTSGGNVFDDVTNSNITSIDANTRIVIQSDGTNWIKIGN